MKRIALSILVCSLIVLFSCKKDESYISMSAMESAVWIEINEFRTDSGKVAATANYDTMVEQAKYYSAFRASGNEDPGNIELQDVWFTIHDRWGGTNDVSITSKVIKGSADISVEDIIDPVKNHSESAAALLSDVNIGGVGVAYDKDGNAYATILMMKVASSQ